MKTKKLLLAFVVLTVCEARSQDTTTHTRLVSFPFWMAKEIALDLVEKERLESQAKLSAFEVENYRLLVGGLEDIVKKKELQIDLLQRNTLSLDTQLRAEKKKKPTSRTFIWTLRLLGSMGLGYLFGVLR